MMWISATESNVCRHSNEQIPGGESLALVRRRRPLDNLSVLQQALASNHSIIASISAASTVRRLSLHLHLLRLLTQCNRIISWRGGGKIVFD